MRTSRSPRIIVACAITFALAWAPAVARAATAPALTSQTIMTEGFESAPPARLNLDWVAPSPGTPYPAYWGPITQQKRSGTRGLWCAGSIPNSTSTNAWNTFFYKYPNYTAGLATFTLPELGEYYSASLDFWYRMPSVGSADGDSFNVLWSSTVGGDFWDYHVGWPVTSTWTQATFNMTAPTPAGFYRPVNLSRTPGKVRFQFMDDASAYESPTNGEGPTIDDVTVAGFKYGPVRDLRTTGVTAQTVSLAWTVPARSTAIGALDDTRSITYHVWRSRDVQPYAWEEVGGGTVGTTYHDPAPRGGTWRYIVQAWDPSPGAGYGQLDTGAGLSVFVDKAPESTIVLDPASPGPDGTYVVPPTVTVSREFQGTTYWRWGSNAFVSSTAATFQVPAPATTDVTRTLEVYSTNSLGTPESPHKTATYALKTYRLEYTAGAGGSVSGAPTQQVFYGSSGTAVTAIPDTGYHFTGWSDGVGTAARTDGGVTTDLVVNATFAINTYALTYSAGANGTISGTSPQSVVHGGTGTAVTAVPNVGHHFTGWSDGVGTAARTDTSVTHAITVTATFAIDTFQLRYFAGAGGSIAGTTSQTVSFNGAGTAVTAVPNLGYHFVGWSDGVGTAARTDSGVTRVITATAAFAIDEVDTFTLLYASGTGGQISGASPQTVPLGGSGAAVTAIPEPGYHFTGWSDGVATAMRTDANISADKSVSAGFALNTYQLRYAAGSGGVISGTASQTVGFGGSGTAVTAVPAAGYHFVTWSDDLPTAARTDSGITSDKSVSAGFALNTYQLRYTAGEGGSITGASSQNVDHSGNGTAVTAVPDVGSHFVAWSDGLESALRTDAGVVGPISVNAIFAVGASDTDKPVTSWPGQLSRYVANVTVTLTATDGYGSGVDLTRYRLDGGAVATYTVPFSITKVAAHTLEFWSVDKAGNAESAHVVTFTVAPPYATVYEPVAPSRVTRGRSFTIYGYVRPKHSSGTYLAYLKFYLKNKYGTYVYHHQIRARRYYYSSTKTKYRATVSLPHRGTWRVRAYHSDSGHSPSYSSYDYISVR